MSLLTIETKDSSRDHQIENLYGEQVTWNDRNLSYFKKQNQLLYLSYLM